MESLMQFWYVWSGWVISAVLLLITLDFLLRFVVPAQRLGKRLRRALDQLNALATPADPERISREIMDRPGLKHLWLEYVQTLHAVRNDPAQPALVSWRATAMAETFFTERSLVDTPLKTDFYRHLPGILTGIGIIGTFSGLIAGLNHFEVSSDTEQVRGSLQFLIQGVGHAFQISAAAITLAMVLTWIEKSLITRRYRQVEQLVQRIDSLFDAGIGEEYLARLVNASETANQQAERFQQKMLLELRQAMLAMLKQQQAANQGQQAALVTQVADAVAKTVAGSLQGPLEKMSAAVVQLQANQGVQLGGALEKALAQFGARLDDSFGQRQDGLEMLLLRTAGALENAVSELGKVAGRMEQVGQRTVESAAGRLDDAGRGIGSAAEFFALSSGDMAASVNALSQAAKGIGQSLADQHRAGAAFGRMVEDLRETIEHARREAALTGELVARMESAASTLGKAGQSAEVYLQGVSEVLAEAHARFAENVERTLSTGNGQFQLQVAGAIEALQGAIEELSDALSIERARRSP